jgi:hypothetical protein
VPLPMVHLTLAVSMLTNLSEPWVSAFLHGSLAPDAIHMRPGTTGEDKRRTHLQVYSTLAVTQGAAVLLGKLGVGDTAADPFLLGYVSHLLTDGLWRALVWLPMQGQLPAQMSSEDRHRLYCSVTDEVDRLLYERMPWRLKIWNLLAAATPRDIAGLLSAREVALWREHTLHWFEHLRPASEPLRFLSLDQTLSFADDTAARIVQWWDDCGVWPLSETTVERPSTQ